MKKYYRCLLLLIALVLILQPMESVFTVNSLATSNNQIAIWGTYSSEKVLQNPEFNYNNYHLKAELDVASATGATESGQIIITTGNKGVEEYVVQTNDLKSSTGEVYKSANVEVFFQHYIKITEKTRLANATSNSGWAGHSKYEEKEYNGDYFPAADINGPLTSGYTPDALIPQKYSIEYNENKINKNANQGITFDFNVPTGTKSGVYTGTFILLIDEEEYEIPVKLTVWGYDISKTNGMNLWDIVDGWYYSSGELTSSDNIYYKYYDALLKYKLNAYHFNENGDNEVHWVESLRKYWQNPAFNGVFFPDFGAERARMLRYFNEIAKACIEDEIDYFSKCRFYHQDEDEPQMKNPSLVPQAVAVIQDTDRILQDFAQDIQGIDGFTALELELQESILSSIIDMPQVVTSDHDKDTVALAGVLDAYCPQICEYDTSAQIRYYVDNAKKMNGEVWTYTCVEPWYPYPSYHIDDFLLSGRSLGWMRNEYDIDCYLMWACNQYNSGLSNGTDDLIPVNPYVEPIRYRASAAGFANGDGYVFYPMAKYEADEPIPSLRLLSARDGQEDYDMLCKLESTYSTLGNEYGVINVEENLKNALTTYYEQIYAGVMPYNESKVFESVRRAIGGLTEAAEGRTKTLVMQNLTNGGKSTSLRIYSLADEIYVNGVMLEKQNGSFNHVANLFDGKNSVKITYVSDGVSKTFEYYLIGKQYAVNLSETTLTSAELSTATINDGILQLTAVSMFDGSMASKAHTVDFAISLDVDFSTLHEISFEVKSKSGVDAIADIGYYYKNSRGKLVTRFCDEMMVYAYEKYNYSYDDIARRVSKIPSSEFDISKIEGIVIRFWNTDWDGNPIEDRTWLISNMYYTINEQG